MRFGHAVQQEDGVIIKEETTGSERIGEYQYVGDDGKLYTVRYSAVLMDSVFSPVTTFHQAVKTLQQP